MTRIADILDGTSQTILVGERPADPEAYWGWWVGSTRVDDDFTDSADLLHYWSAHTGGAHFAMCDGSVQFLSYSIDHETFLARGSRNGGEVVSEF